MKHDDQCELGQGYQIVTPYGVVRTLECHCGSRAYPLCDGCRDGRHLKHRDGDCSCDLCADQPAAVAS